MRKLYISNPKYFIYLSCPSRIQVLNFLLKQWEEIMFFVVQVKLALIQQATLRN